MHATGAGRSVTYPRRRSVARSSSSKRRSLSLLPLRRYAAIASSVPTCVKTAPARQLVPEARLVASLPSPVRIRRGSRGGGLRLRPRWSPTSRASARAPTWRFARDGVALTRAEPLQSGGLLRSGTRSPRAAGRFSVSLRRLDDRARDAGDDAGRQRHDAGEGKVRVARHQGQDRHRSRPARRAAVGDVHIIQDESRAVAKTVVVQLIPKDARRRIDVLPAPGNCPF